MCQFLPGVPFERHILRNCLHSWNLFQLWRHSPLPFNQAGFKFVNLFSHHLQLEPIYQILHTMFLATHPVRLIFAPHNRPPGSLQEVFELHKASPGSITSFPYINIVSLVTQEIFTTMLCYAFDNILFNSYMVPIIIQDEFVQGMLT